MSARRVVTRSLALLGAIAVALIVLAGPAAADPVSDAASDLKSSAVYLEPGALNRQGKTITLDESAVQAAAGSTVKIAVFGSGTSVNAGNQIEPGLGTRKVLAVVVPGDYATDSNYLCDGRTGPVLKAALNDHSTDVADGDYTAALVQFAQRVVQVPERGTAACTSGGTSGAAGSSGDSDGTSAWPWVAGIGGLAVLGGGGYAFSRRRKQQRELAAAQANVMPYYDRLANDVNTLDAKDDKTARQALADASERYNAAGSQMSTATTVQNWAIVRRTTLEGLQAAQTAREALGLPKGPDLPPVDQARGKQLTQAQQVDVQGQQYQGYPSYTPGAPYYYGGGAGYPGGWYTFPFWETLLIGSTLGGGWGFGGGGYGNGYDSGYTSGYDAGQSSGNSGGDGNWGGFSSGDSGWGGGFDGGGGGFGGGGSDGGSF